MLLSIVIPCYNCEKTISETLDSINAQTFKDFEIIVVNDGSTDKSIDVLEGYKKNSSMDIAIITTENLGVSAARNIGIKASKGRYIYFLDADDLICSTLFEKFAKVCEYKSFDTVCFKSSREADKFTDRKIAHKTITVDKAIKFLAFGKKHFQFWTYFYNREILLSKDISFTLGCTHGEDWEFAFKYLVNCNSCAFINDIMHYYRITDASVSNKMSKNQINAIYAAERTTEYMRQNSKAHIKLFENYMFPKVLFSVLRRSAKFCSEEIFNTVINAYNVRKSFRKLVFYPKTDLKTRIAAILYLINNKLFYKLAKRLG